MVKQISILFLALAAILSRACPVFAQAGAEQPPRDAAAAVMEEIKAWNAAPVAAMLDRSLAGHYGEDVLRSVLVPVLDRMEYTVGNAKAEGRKASVDLAVTAADIGEISTSLLSDALGIMVLKELTGMPVDVEAYMAKRLETVMEEKKLYTIKTDTTMYLVMGGDGAWKLDVGEPRNLGLLEAVSGGLLDFSGILDTFDAAAAQYSRSTSTP